MNSKIVGMRIALNNYIARVNGLKEEYCFLPTGSYDAEQYIKGVEDAKIVLNSTIEQLCCGLKKSIANNINGGKINKTISAKVDNISKTIFGIAEDMSTLNESDITSNSFIRTISGDMIQELDKCFNDVISFVENHNIEADK